MVNVPSHQDQMQHYQIQELALNSHHVRQQIQIVSLVAQELMPVSLIQVLLMVQQLYHAHLIHVQQKL